jgi:alkylation response protein AidB-like acyl-CoA dehydrogenase
VIVAQVIDQLEEHAGRLAELGAENERLGRLSDETAKIMRAVGLMRLLQPASHGGFEAHPAEFATATMKLASYDGASGWVLGVVGVHPWELAQGDRRAQDEVWGDDPDTWVASPFTPMGTARPVDGGYIFNGRWSFSSGTDHCQWVYLGAMLTDAEGTPLTPPRSLHLLIPRTDYDIVPDSWDVVGLRGTGSKDVIVKDAYVPDYRVMDQARLNNDEYAKELNLPNPTYHLPYSCAFPLGITAATIGIAMGGLAHHLNYQRGRTNVFGTKLREDPYALAVISEAAAEINAARAALFENVNRQYDVVAAGGEVSFEDRAIGRRTQVHAAWRAVRALDEVFDRSGGNAMRMNNPLQRFWRDAHTGLAHAIHIPGLINQASALTQLGFEVPDGPLRAMI